MRRNYTHLNMPKTVNQLKDIMAFESRQGILRTTRNFTNYLIYYNIYAKHNQLNLIPSIASFFYKHKFKRRSICPPQKCVRSLLLIILLNKVLQALKRERMTWSNGRHERWGGGCCGMRKRRNGWISGWHQCYNSV